MASSNSCPATEQWRSLSVGDLSDEAAAPLESHLLECAACVERMRGIPADDRFCSAVRSAEAVPTDIPEVVRRIIVDLGDLDHVRTLVPFRDDTDHPDTGSQDDLDGILPHLETAHSAGELGRLGGFRIIRLLGAGGMGLVFEGEDLHLRRPVAIKVLKPALGRRDNGAGRFLQEARAAAAVRHPRVVTIYQAGEANGVPFIAQELLQGETLESRLKRVGRLPVDQVLRIGIEMARGLSSAHRAGLLHRDVKPSNTWLESPDDAVKILDFGLARLQEDDAGLTQAGTILGTPPYMSPEQARGETVTTRSDLFSLGSVLYRAAAGRLPFSGDSALSILHAVSSLDPRPIEELCPEAPRSLAALIGRLLAKSPIDRPADAETVAAELERIRDESACSDPVRPDLARVATRSSKEQGTPRKVEASPRTATCVGPERSVGAGRWKAIAATCGAILMAGVVVVITSRNGTRTEIRVPEGAHVEIREEVERAPPTTPRNPIAVPRADLPNPKTAPPADLAEPIGAARTAGQAWHGWPPDAPDPAIAPFSAAQARQHQEAWARYLRVPVEFTNSVGVRFRLVPPGAFVRGGTAAEIREASAGATSNVLPRSHRVQCFASEAPQHTVVHTRPFFLGVDELTQAEYRLVTGKSPSQFASVTGEENYRARVEGQDTSHFPVESVVWSEAAEFCNALGARDGLPPSYARSGGNFLRERSDGYRLPTDAEWEFACRAGTTTRYWSGDSREGLLEIGLCAAQNADTVLASRSFEPNPFGFRAMHGNVAEWVDDVWRADSFQRFRDDPAVDPVSRPPAISVGFYVLRGGSRTTVPEACRSSCRFGAQPAFRSDDVGFRIVLPFDAARGLIAARDPGPQPESRSP